jgi:predicted Zn-dependent peptidase
LGGELNAYTDRELTCFHADCPADQLEEIMKLIVEMLLDPQFTKQEFESERQVVVQEIVGYEDNPEDVFSDLSLEVPWASHPLGLRIGGRSDQVKKLSYAGVYRFIESTFLPAPWTISVVSPLKIEDVKKMLTRVLNDAKSYRYSKLLKIARKPKKFGGEARMAAPWVKRSLAHKMLSEQVQVAFSFPSVGIRERSEVYYTALSSILGMGAGSLLYRELREKLGLVYHVSAHNLSFSDAGVLMGQWSCTQDHLEEAAFAAARVCALLAWGGVPESEVRYTMDCLRGVVKMSFDGIRGRMEAMGRQEVLIGYSLSLSEMLRELEKINKNRLDSCARAMRKKPCFLLVGPVGKRELLRVQTAWDRGLLAGRSELIANPKVLDFRGAHL